MGLVRNLSLREIWEIYIKAVKSQDQSADNVKVGQIYVYRQLAFKSK